MHGATIKVTKYFVLQIEKPPKLDESYWTNESYVKGSMSRR